MDNSIDEALAGYCSDIKVIIHKDNSITVIDNGRGIPVDMMKKEQKPAVEVIMTVLHAGGKFGDGGYKVSGGLHGVGVTCVNALSEHMEVEVRRGGKCYGIEFAKGKTSKKLYEKGDCETTGTTVHFKPDATIFTETEYSYDTLRLRIRELAFLNKGITISLTDERAEDKSETFHFAGGIIEYVEFMDKDKNKIIRSRFIWRVKRMLLSLRLQCNIVIPTARIFSPMSTTSTPKKAVLISAASVRR